MSHATFASFELDLGLHFRKVMVPNRCYVARAVVTWDVTRASIDLPVSFSVSWLSFVVRCVMCDQCCFLCVLVCDLRVVCFCLFFAACCLMCYVLHDCFAFLFVDSYLFFFVVSDSCCLVVVQRQRIFNANCKCWGLQICTLKIS